MDKACIVLPTYNEASNIPEIIPRIFEQSSAIPTHELHVLVVDDNSPDGTANIVQTLQPIYPLLHLISGKKSGLGDAYKRGFSHALQQLQPQAILQMDADFQHDPKLIPMFIYLNQCGFSLVIGSRFAYGGSTPEFGLRRKALSHFGNWLLRFFGGLPGIRDCTSGYRCFSAHLLSGSDFSYLLTTGYAFQASLLFELLRNGAKTIEVPIVFRPRSAGVSKLGLKDQFEFVFNLFRLRFRKSEDFFRFAAIGAIGVCVNLASFLALSRGTSLAPELASLLAILLAIANNAMVSLFLARDARTIPLERKPSKTFLNRTAFWGGSINFLGFLFFYKYFKLGGLLSQLLGVCLGSFFHYALNAYQSLNEPANDPSDLTR